MEQSRLGRWRPAKVTVDEMARVVQRHKSTVLSETKRNFWADDAPPKNYARYSGMASYRIHCKLVSDRYSAKFARVPTKPDILKSRLKQNRPAKTHWLGSRHYVKKGLTLKCNHWRTD